MVEISTSRLRQILAGTIGPAPWYWETFPAFTSASGQRFVWSNQGKQGPLAHWFRCIGSRSQRLLSSR